MSMSSYKMNNQIKTVLNDILENVSKFKKEKESQKQSLKLIADSGNQISEMIENSLDMFKMEEGTYDFNPSPCNLIEVFNKLTSDLDFIARQKNVQLQYFIDDQPLLSENQFWISGEFRLLQNLFANLLKNAIEASPSGEIVRIDLDHQPEDKSIIQIHNMGVVPKNLRDCFFDRYATSGKKGGTGLGTYSAKLITKTHRGSIRFETDESMGTILFVSLPSAQQPEASKKQDLTPSYTEITLKGKVLMADDNPINQQVIKGLLEDHSIHLDMVENGQMAVDQVIESNYDLVLMDMEMPVMDGREATEMIRKQFSHTDLPIIALTAHNLDLVEFNQNLVLINDVITKPVQPSKLYETLQKYLENVSKTNQAPKPDTDDPKTEHSQKKMSSQVLNLDKALHQLLGKRDLLETVMESFRKDHVNSCEIIKELIESNQLSSAQLKVHSVKGLAGTIGASMLQGVAQELETALKKNMVSKFNQLLISFQECLDPVIDEIGKVLPPKTPKKNDPELSDTLSEQLTSLEKNMNQLYELLLDCDSDANDVCDECLPALEFLTQNTNDRLMLDKLKHHLKNYLFDDAAEVLETLTHQLGMDLNK